MLRKLVRQAQAVLRESKVEVKREAPVCHGDGVPSTQPDLPHASSQDAQPVFPAYEDSFPETQLEEEDEPPTTEQANHEDPEGQREGDEAKDQEVKDNNQPEGRGAEHTQDNAHQEEDQKPDEAEANNLAGFPSPSKELEAIYERQESFRDLNTEGLWSEDELPLVNNLNLWMQMSQDATWLPASQDDYEEPTAAPLGPLTHKPEPVKSGEADLPEPQPVQPGLQDERPAPETVKTSAPPSLPAACQKLPAASETPDQVSQLPPTQHSSPLGSAPTVRDNPEKKAVLAEAKQPTLQPAPDKASEEPDYEAPVIEMPSHPPAPLSERAAKARLYRVVQPRKDGSYLVPDEIIKMYADKIGDGRGKVLSLFEKTGYNPDWVAKLRPEGFLPS